MMGPISKRKKVIACFLLLTLLNEMIFPTAAYALTGGPSQPEVQSFEPVNTDKMVDLFSGDFVYNIPLMDVEGYPINMSYHSGITMDQEASWTGLGWNINPGVINRSMRGLPDDFLGDPIVKEYNIRPNWTAGVDLGAGFQVVGCPIGLGANMGIFYNNYKGVGFKGGANFHFSFSQEGKKGSKTSGLKGSLGLGLSFNSQEGVGISPSMGLSLEKNNSDNSSTSFGMNAGLSYNNRSGVGALSISASVSSESKYLNEEGKERSHSRSMFNGNSSISFASASVTPSIEMPLESFGFTAKLHAGGEIPYTDFQVSGDITGSYTIQKLSRHRDTLSGYGYLNFDQVGLNPRALMDFNREKDQPFRKPNRLAGDEGTPIMAIPNYQFDVLSVSGQGISGSYRPMRGDLGAVYDHETTTRSASGTFNGDAEFGGWLALGADIDVNIVNTTVSYWDDGNDLHNKLRFYPSDNTLYEPSYYLNIGEKTINDQEFYDAIGDIDPVRSKIDGWWLDKYVPVTLEQFHNHVKQTDFPLKQFKKKGRAKRNQAISYLTAEESTAALEQKILSYPVNKFPIQKCSGIDTSVMQIPRIAQSSQRRSHLSEISVIGTDGKRYVYGIPAYNRVQHEVTFNVKPNDQAVDNGIVDYKAGVDNSINNSNGLDNYYSSEQIPDFSHSFLLTAVLSPDYVDLTGNGISDDDLGDAVRINYSRIYPSNNTALGLRGFRNRDELYKWRVPTDSAKANYQQGYKANPDDDKANYIYGEKELWYVNSIESKTMVAVFRTSDRQDGLGVKGENGGVDTAAKMKKLDKIDLYSKSDLLKDSLNAVPIKSVHFEYSYSLCKGVTNSMTAQTDTPQGKLTLEKVYFTYQKNTKGRLNPYVFHYDNPNPNYHLKHYDRWGNYKSNRAAGIQVPDSEFPYTIQDTAVSDSNARAWSLSSIDLPTGGEIKIKLEADRYGYVQDKRAMQMYNICGIGYDSNFDEHHQLYTPSNLAQVRFNNFIYIKVDDPILASSTADQAAEIESKYLEGIENLYFRAAVAMPGMAIPNADYVPGYTRIDTFGLCPGHNNIIYLRLHPQPLNNGNFSGQINPIQKTAMQTLRMNLPFLAYPGSFNNGQNFVGIIKSLIAPIFDIENIFFGFGGSCIWRGWCQDVDLSRSWVRLDNPMHSKLGGGCRVKQVTIDDKWDHMVTGETHAVYGQIYDYTMEDEATKQIISSGVAEYEPMVGNDENPWRQPLISRQNTLLAPHNQLFMETPIGESFFPSASVGYRQVKVSSYGSATVASEKRTGYSLHNFYTAYEFPVSTDYTPLLPKLDKTPFIFQILQFPSIEHFLGTQGFQIELNDMHGKPRSEEVHDNLGAIISKTSYEYEVEDPTALHKKLNTKVLVMKPDGSTEKANVGKDIELMFDSRKESTIAQNYGGLLQCDMVQVPFPIFVLPLFTYFPSFAREETVFKSLATMKVVRRYGLIKSVTTQQYGSEVTSENLMYDSESGEVLLTKTKNEFEDPIYNLTYPAHIAYSGMGPASQNVGAVFHEVKVNNGLVANDTLNSALEPGDEILYSEIPIGFPGIGGGNQGNIFNIYLPRQYWKLWIIDPHTTDLSKNSQKIFIDNRGIPFSSNGIHPTIKITRSGHRNLQTAAIASITSLSNPLLHDGVTDFDTIHPQVTDSILNVTNTEYDQRWKINCDKVPKLDCDVCRTPTCECMSNLLTQVLTVLKDHPNPQLSDNLMITNCCFDSCFYSGGTSSGNYEDCGRPIYALDTNRAHYVLMFGRCTLTIVNSDPFRYGERGMNTLSAANPDDEILLTESCTTACDAYSSSDPKQYYLVSLEAGGPIVPFFATLDCGQRCNPSCANLDTGGIINPYRYGLLGNWRPLRQWAYRGLRSDSIPANGKTNIRRAGTFQTYDQFWVYDNTEKVFVKNPTLSNRYIDATTITKYNTKGAEIENRDAAGIYSSAQFGYLNTQAVAVAKNARYKQMGFDGFEDYDFMTDCTVPCRQDHFDYANVACLGCANAVIDSVIAHSGNRSLKVIGSGSGTARMSRDLLADNDGPGLNYDSIYKEYRLNIDGCLPKFSPDSGRYFVSAWVRERDSCISTRYTNCELKISYNGSTAQYIFAPSGKIIDGWQRIQGVFDVPSPAMASEIYVDLISLNGKDVYFDDVRVQPFNSSMKSYVYDWRSQRLMAELDENNFATFYEYDDEGILIRIKKETERGIMTIQETRSALTKHPL